MSIQKKGWLVGLALFVGGLGSLWLRDALTGAPLGLKGFRAGVERRHSRRGRGGRRCAGGGQRCGGGLCGAGGSSEDSGGLSSPWIQFVTPEGHLSPRPNTHVFPSSKTHQTPPPPAMQMLPTHSHKWAENPVNNLRTGLFFELLL